MPARSTPWPHPAPATEQDVRAALRASGLEANGWSNGPGDRYAAHAHPYDKVLYCARGSIRFDLPDEGTSVHLAPGDRLDLAAGTRHAAEVGPEGVVCYEAHLPVARG